MAEFTYHETGSTPLSKRVTDRCVRAPHPLYRSGTTPSRRLSYCLGLLSRHALVLTTDQTMKQRLADQMYLVISILLVGVPRHSIIDALNCSR